MTESELLEIIQNNEGEHLEFKEAKNNYSVMGGGEVKNKYSVYGYCVALGNEGGGKLVLGIEDKTKKIVGTNALQNTSDVTSKIFRKLGLKIKIN